MVRPDATLLLLSRLPVLSDETLDLAESFSYGGGKVCSGTTTLCVEVLSDPKG